MYCSIKFEVDKIKVCEEYLVSHTTTLFPFNLLSNLPVS